MRFIIIGHQGQGVTTLARILAKAGALSGLYSQAYSEISDEVVKGYVRFSKDPITEKGPVIDPEYYIIFDEKLLSFKEVLDGKIVVISAMEKPSSPWIKKKKLKVHYVDAVGIGQSFIKRPFPSTALLGALLKPFNKISMKSMKLAIEADIKARPKENQTCVEEGYKNVK